MDSERGTRFWQPSGSCRTVAPDLDAWERGLPLLVRVEAGGMLFGVRLSADGQLALSLRGRAQHPTLASLVLHTFPALGVVDVVEAALAFGRALVRAVLRRDRSQASNLRLSAFRRSLRETGEPLREACQKDAKVNPTPEPYRAFAIARAASRASEAPMPAGTKLRYSTRWRALVPGIDLRATFLCGDRTSWRAAAETFCLDRATGRSFGEPRRSALPRSSLLGASPASTRRASRRSRLRQRRGHAADLARAPHRRAGRGRSFTCRGSRASSS